MSIAVLNQMPNGFNLSNELNQTFITGDYTSLRILMAYISWDGISLIHEELEKFHDNNKSVEMIIGLSGGLSDPSTLTYLLERLPKSNIYVFHTPTINYTFHPKVYFFENQNEILVYIGSNNFTLGGLFYNSECCVKLKISKNDNAQLCSEINAIWETYKTPHNPFGQGNLKRINKKIISLYEKHIKASIRRKSAPRWTSFDKLFSSIVMPSTPVTRMKKTAKRLKTQPIIRGKTLLLQVLNETGAAGTQVQIPRAVVENYFGLETYGHQTIELQFIGKNLRPAVLCHFSNNTHRISFFEVASYKRPLLMKFIKQKEKFYTVELLSGSQYEKYIKLCDKQTRYAAKKWAIL